jgi:hypothetical protein
VCSPMSAEGQSQTSDDVPHHVLVRRHHDAVNCDVRFTPESGHQPDIAPCPLRARSGHSSVRFVIFIPSDADYDGRRADWIFERKKLKPRGDYV